LALTLFLGLLATRSSAVHLRSGTYEDAHYEWWQPVAGILRVELLADQMGDELFTTVHHHHRHPPLSLLEELNEEADDSEAHVNNTDTKAGHIDTKTGPKVVFVSGAAVGATKVSGAGKTGAQITFAGATNAAANKVAASVAASNALSVATSLAHVNTDAKGKVITVANAKGKVHPIVALGWFVWLRASLSIGFAVKSMCMMCNIFYQASPLPLITGYRDRGDTGDADLAPFIATAYGGWQWCFYGMFAYMVTGKSGFLVLVYSNIVGATLGLYYVYAFNCNCHDKGMISKTTKYYSVLATIVTIQFIAIMSLQPVKALFFCGLISSAWSMIGSASLVATVPKVFETRDSRSLPLPLLVMGTLSAILWIICGIMLWDPWITFPNMFAFCVCIFALYLCYIYPADGVPNFQFSWEADCGCETDARDVNMGSTWSGDFSRSQHEIDVERASPLQRALGLVSRSALSGDAKDKSGEYNTCGTGGTGDSF